MTGAAGGPLSTSRVSLGRDEIRATGAWIAAAQHGSGAIPWDVVGDTAGKVDAWDHVESAMGLLVAGFDDHADAAYDWLARAQRPDGTWPIRWRADDRGVEVLDPGVDPNMGAYVAVGVRHHHLVRGDDGFLQRMWPVVDAALDAVCAMRLPGGGIAWGAGAGGVATTALVTGSASIHHSLVCGLELADIVGEPRPEWEACRAALAAALRRYVAGDAGDFEHRTRWSMDWYYPVLGGAVRGPAARERLASRWDDFVVPGLGLRCVDDRPWVTGAETCELALALQALGRREEAADLVADMQHLREEDGSYHTGFVFADNKRWPIERSTWTSGAVLLAVDALTDLTPGAAVFRV